MLTLQKYNIQNELLSTLDVMLLNYGKVQVTKYGDFITILICVYRSIVDC